MSSLGKSGPKARRGRAADGQQAEIPAPRGDRTAGTRAEGAGREAEIPARAGRPARRKNHAQEAGPPQRSER